MTEPVNTNVDGEYGKAPAVVIEHVHEDDRTGALYVHKDLVLVRADWAVEEHIGPVMAYEKFGDVESWVAYIAEYQTPGKTMVSWGSLGLRAVLDYHEVRDNALYAGRCQWIAEQPFERSPEWNAWTSLATGQAIPQRAAVERLETLADDIVEPTAAALIDLLRNLRANVTATAQTELRPDGTTAVAFNQDKRIAGAANAVELPPIITIAIPVLKGHVDASGKPVRYQLKVRLRAQVDDTAHLALRFSIDAAEKVLEEVFAEQVARAKVLLGDEYTLLRTAG